MVGAERKSQGLRGWEVGGARKEGHQVGPFVVLCPGVSLAGQSRPFISFFFNFLFILFNLYLILFYLTVLGLCCGMGDLVPRSGIEPGAPLRWECGVLVTGPPGKSQARPL